MLVFPWIAWLTISLMGSEIQPEMLYLCMRAGYKGCPLTLFLLKSGERSSLEWYLPLPQEETFLIRWTANICMGSCSWSFPQSSHQHQQPFPHLPVVPHPAWDFSEALWEGQACSSPCGSVLPRLRGCRYNFALAIPSRLMLVTLQDFGWEGGPRVLTFL